MTAGLVPFGQSAASDELKNIADWWLKHSLDTHRGGFIGEVDYHGLPVMDANKGIILNSRILWFFSESCQLGNNPEYRAAADRAFRYLVDHFDDKQHGGAFWELSAYGSLVNGKKQVYALCFCIYAFTAYYRLTSEPEALSKSLEYFQAIETHARDHQHGGYFEAFSQQWQSLADVRLGADDINAPKTMNTHLHLLEAYTALHKTTPSGQTEEALRYTVDLFCRHFVNRETGHLRLFFDTQWNSLSPTVSFGHDIEASWLLWESVEVLADPALTQVVRPIVEQLADVCQRRGIGSDGQLCYEYNPLTNHRSEAGIWWVQAEALVGFLNAYRLTMERRFLDSCNNVWQHICDYHIDPVAGEWHWLSASPDTDVRSHYKAGFWKAPYHNGRAMMQACSLFEVLSET